MGATLYNRIPLKPTLFQRIVQLLRRR